ncbi:MAG: polyribonucleotide nucleotidyltransferase [Verrucomicrobia bacterium]|nr:polyribonucleotide nucleotidyltransferase [Verrucomicrobiota bacterium]MDA1086214.1 polyribonucleotide nucleotidyltransferase [Verrucomicrobiota bacterium]
MRNTTSVSVDVGGKQITIESGLLAKQAGGAVTVQLGETVLFSASTRADHVREGIDYFPLQVEYREKFYAAGRFPGGFFKREQRPSEKETVTARFTDRPIRPLFPKYYRNEVQIINMLLSADGQNDSDAISILAASASLTLSEIPFMGPIAAVRVGRVDGQFIMNPTNEERETSDLDLIYACTRELPLMIEGGGKEIKEADLLAAMRLAQAECVKLIDAQLELRSKLGLPEKIVEEPASDDTILKAAHAKVGEELAAVLLIPGKLERQGKVSDIGARLKEALLVDFPEMTDEEYRSAFDDLEIELVRENVIKRGKRIDGRASDDVRPLSGDTGILPRTHGSALFQRGETQALTSVTLASAKDSQGLDGITGGPRQKSFLLHYNFPPYSVGECGRVGGVSRREIGHGALAEKSISEVMPDDYPYAVRVVSDVMGSNGSTSMGSVCSGSLALLDAGVPLKRPVAGISVGLFASEDKDELVIDILGAEDHCGDMDFKVAGTTEGITGFQADLKIRGLKWELVEAAFAMALKARLHILDFMSTVISEPRAELSPFAPRIHEVHIDPEKIGELIGPGGKNIRRITELTGTQIDIGDDGTVKVYSSDGESLEMAIREIDAITAEADVGSIYDGVVTGVKDFGAFVEILPGKDGLVHISELADFRVNTVEDICTVGDQMWVKCIGIDDRGRVRLSRREALKDKQLNEEAEKKESDKSAEAEAAPVA